MIFPKHSRGTNILSLRILPPINEVTVEYGIWNHKIANTYLSLLFLIDVFADLCLANLLWLLLLGDFRVFGR